MTVASLSVSFPLVIYHEGCRSVSLCVTLQLEIYVVSTRDKVSRVENLLKNKGKKEKEEENNKKERNIPIDVTIIPQFCLFLIIARL